MASPAAETFSPREDKYFKVPNEFAENQHLFIHAEKCLALLLFREARNAKGFTDLNGIAKVPDQMWIEATKLKPRMMELAVRGLQAKGLEVNRRKPNASAQYSWNWNKWNSAFLNPEPSSYDRERKARDAAASKKVHPDCATGCARLREMQALNSGDKSVSPVLVMPTAQPVARCASDPKKAKEEQWPKTMTAMRAISTDVGLALLRLLLMAVAALKGLGVVADGVLAAAVRNAAQHRGQRLEKYGVVLLVNIVPNVLATWKARGMRLDVEPEETPAVSHMRAKWSPGDIKQARDIIQAVDSGREEFVPSGQRWSEQDVQWARDVLASSESSPSREADSVRPGEVLS